MTDKCVKSQTLVLFSLVLRRVRLAGARAGRFLALEHNTRPAQADWADGHRFIHTLHKSRTLYLLRDCLQSVDEFPIPSKLSYFIIVNFPTVALLRPVHLRILERSFPGLRPEPITLLDSSPPPIRFLVSKPRPIRMFVDNSNGWGRANARHALRHLIRQHCAIYLNKLRCKWRYGVMN